MIRINEDYLIGFDSLNIILYKRINGKGGDRKFYQESYYEAMTFHGDFNSLTNALIHNKIKCSGKMFEELQDIIIAIDEFKQEVFNKIKIEIRKVYDLDNAEKFLSKN